MIEPKPSQLRKYIYEYCLIGLSVCVVYLFLLYASLQKYIREGLTQQVINTTLIINENNRLLKQFNNNNKNENNETNRKPFTLSHRDI